MKKLIRLLVEGLFDDIYDLNNDVNDVIELGNEIYSYKVGDIYYLNKKPYAICCGESKVFNDNKSRFCLYKQKKYKLQWSNKSINKIIKQIAPNFYSIKNLNDRTYLDENGYENTLFIKNNFNISDFPIFTYCCKFGDDVYIPAIDELSVWYLNKEKMKYINKSIDWYWSSTSSFYSQVYGLNLIDSYIAAFYSTNVMFINLFVKLK